MLTVLMDRPDLTQLELYQCLTALVEGLRNEGVVETYSIERVYPNEERPRRKGLFILHMIGDIHQACQKLGTSEAVAAACQPPERSLLRR